MIRVEFFGIPRNRAGVAAVECAANCLGDLLLALARRFPSLATDCFAGDRLREGYAANLNGDQFVTDSATPLGDGDCVLILSADAGG